MNALSVIVLVSIAVVVAANVPLVLRRRRHDRREASLAGRRSGAHTTGPSELRAALDAATRSAPGPEPTGE
ncbi:MAG: hypothetical protein ACO3WU_02165 [Ilumatobacteraceae bacterium]